MRAQAFADALNLLETQGDVDRFVADQFADDAQLARPEADLGAGDSSAADFWRQYLAQFDEVRSTFNRVVDADALAVLEWTSIGRLTGGAPIEYRGVSVLDFDDTGGVRRFVTYYDTQPFALTARGTAGR